MFRNREDGKKLRGRCAICGTYTHLGCGKCKQEWYCGERCQQIDDKRHCCHDLMSIVNEGEKPDGDDVGVKLDVMTFPCKNAIAFDNTGNRMTPVWNQNVVPTNWKHEKKIGVGSYGAVDEYVDDSGNHFAVKFMRLDREHCVSGSILAELCIRNISHPNVSGTCRVGTAHDPIGNEYIAMVMDKAVMDIKNYAKQSKQEQLDLQNAIMPPDEFAVVAYQIIRGIAVLHANAIVHGDIKPGNILIGDAVVSGGNQCKQAIVADLGLSFTAYIDKQNTVGGTPGFEAPEILLSSNDYDDYVDVTMASDIWACGVSLYQLAIGKPLFDADQEEKQELLIDIFATLGTPRYDEWKTLSDYPKYVEWRNSLLGYHHGKRDRIKQKLMVYPGFYKLFKEMVKMDPNFRPMAHQILGHPYFNKSKRASLGNMTVREYVEANFPGGGARPPTADWFFVGRLFTMHPDWVMEVLNTTQLVISGKARQEARQTTAMVSVIEKIHLDTVLQLIGIAGRDKDTDLRFEILFKAIDLLNMMRMATTTIPLLVGKTTSVRGHLASVLYMIAKKTLTKGTSVYYRSTIRSLTTEEIQHGIPLVEKWVLETIDFDVGRPTVYDFIRWKTRVADVSNDEDALWLPVVIGLVLSTNAEFLERKKPSDIAEIALSAGHQDRAMRQITIANDVMEHAEWVWKTTRSDQTRRFEMMLRSGIVESFRALLDKYTSKQSLLRLIVRIPVLR